MSQFEPITLHANGLRFSALTAGRGPVVICLHGFPDCMRSYRHQLPAFAAAGYRAIAPMMRGYEPSSQPASGDYHIVRMAEDVIGWLGDLGEERVHLIGHDWGAIVGYVAAAMAPERFHSLTTIAIPHLGGMERGHAIRHVPKQIRNSWYAAFFQLRGISDAIVSARSWAFIDKLWRDWSPGWQWPAEELVAVKQTLAQPGVKSAALGYYRAFIDLSEAAKQTRRLLRTPIRVPTLALTGALDGCMDTRLYEHAMSEREFHAAFRVARFDDAGHFLHQEQPERTNTLLVEWVKSHSLSEPAGPLR